MFVSQNFSFEPEAESPSIHEVRVARRAPLFPLAWIAVGILAPFGIYALWRFHAIHLLTLAEVSVLPLFLYALYVGISAATVWAWLTGPRIFVLGSMGFRLGEREVGYRSMAYLRHDYSWRFTDVGLYGGDRIRLRWAIWPAHSGWIDALVDQTWDRLQAEAVQKLKRGEDLIFGKELRLNQQAVTARSRSIPIREIAFVDSLSGTDSGVDYRVLRIGAAGKTTEIDMSGIENPHVLFGLLHQLIEQGESRIP